MDKTICVFGDSVVQAAYVKTSWVDLLKNYLEEIYANDFINIFNLGIGGNTTDDIVQRLESEIKARGATTIIFGIGVNDSGYFKILSKPIEEESRFVSNLKKITSIAKKYTEDIIFVGLVLGDDSLLQPFPESSKGKLYERKRTEMYDGLIKTTVGKECCKYVNLLDKLKFSDFFDGLHPNESGHQKMFDEIKKYL